MRKLVMSCCCVMIGFSIQAQQGKVKTTVLGEQAKATENATVELLRSKDSGIVKIALSDKSGLVELGQVVFGQYLLRVTVVNFAPSFSAPFSVSEEQKEVTVPPVTLQPK